MDTSITATAQDRSTLHHRAIIAAAICGIIAGVVCPACEAHVAQLYYSNTLTAEQLLIRALLYAIVTAVPVLILSLAKPAKAIASKGKHARYSVSSPKGPISFHALVTKRLLLCALIIFASWCLWVVPHLPGTMRDDTIPQMLQWYGIMGWYTQHPVLDSLVFGLFWSLGDLLGSKLIGLAVYIFVQSAALSFTLTLALAYGHKLGAPKALLIVVLLLCCFAPPMYQSVDAMSKDSLNSIFFALAVMLYAEIVRTSGEYLEKGTSCTATVVVIFLAIATRRTTMYILALAWLFLLVRVVRQRRHTSTVVTAVAAIVIPICLFQFVWTPVTNVILDVHDSPSQSLTALSVPGQQVIRTARDHPERIDDETKALINSVIDYDIAVQIYSPTRSDEIFWNPASNPEPRNLLVAWIRLLPSSLDSYLDAFLDMTTGWLSLRNPIAYGHNMHDELFTSDERLQWEAALFGGDASKSEAFFAEFMRLPSLGESNSLAQFEEAVYTYEVTAPIAKILSSYGFWCFVVPLMSLGISIGRGNTTGILIALVGFLVLLSYLAGPMVLYWYSVSSVMIMPILLVAAPYAHEEGLDRQP